MMAFRVCDVLTAARIHYFLNKTYLRTQSRILTTLQMAKRMQGYQGRALVLWDRYEPFPATVAATAATAAAARVCTFANKRQPSSSEMHVRESFAQVTSLLQLKNWSNSTGLTELFILIRNLSSLLLNSLLCMQT